MNSSMVDELAQHSERAGRSHAQRHCSSPPGSSSGSSGSGSGSGGSGGCNSSGGGSGGSWPFPRTFVGIEPVSGAHNGASYHHWQVTLAQHLGKGEQRTAQMGAWDAEKQRSMGSPVITQFAGLVASGKSSPQASLALFLPGFIGWVPSAATPMGVLRQRVGQGAMAITKPSAASSSVERCRRWQCWQEAWVSAAGATTDWAIKPSASHN